MLYVLNDIVTIPWQVVENLPAKHLCGGQLPYAQNFGRVKLWQINCFRVLSRENVGEFYISYFSESGIWLGKILVNDITFAKSAKVFHRQDFALYGI